MNVQIVELVHSIFCNKKHTHNIEDLIVKRKEGLCYFYLESQLSTYKEMTDHKEWNSKAEEMIELLELDDHKMINFLADLGGIVGSIKLMESRYPRFREILRSIIDL